MHAVQSSCSTAGRRIVKVAGSPALCRSGAESYGACALVLCIGRYSDALPLEFSFGHYEDPRPAGFSELQALWSPPSFSRAKTYKLPAGQWQLGARVYNAEGGYTLSAAGSVDIEEAPVDPTLGLWEEVQVRTPSATTLS
jgi:hypothetical protein